MNLQKLLPLRDGHKSVINHHLEKISDAKENGRLREFNAILAVLEEKVKLLDGLNEKILNQTEADGVGEELMATGDFSLNLEIKMSELRVFRSRGEPSSEGGATPPTCSQSTSSAPTNGIAFQSRAQTVSDLSYCSSNSSQFHRLPKLVLPKFDGDILTWQTFWDSFESTVHYNVSLTDIQKFSYLNSQLECEAARTIEGLALTSANYLRAVDLLRERYGQVHKIAHVTMQTMLRLPAPVNNVHSLRHFCDKLESYIRSLEAIGQFEESYGSLLVPVILDKLPAELKRQIAREHGDGNWKLTDLRQALKKELRIMEAGTSSHQPEVEDYNATASFFTRAKPKKNHSTFTRNTSDHPKVKCAYCKEEHVATECRKYVDAEARIVVIKQEKLCFNCLGKHQVAQCKSNKRCKKCHRKHHSSICQTLRESERETRTHTPDTTSNLNPEAAVFHSSLKQNTQSTVLLKTAIATVSSHNTYMTASVLFDEGAQRSFITRKLADELQLAPETTEKIHLSAFGGDSSKVQHLERTTVHIRTENSHKIPIRVLIVPRLATPMINHVTEAVDRYPYLRKLKLAHPASSDHQFDISILIGADHYWNIVDDEIIRGKEPTAMKSKLGYLLSGPLPDTARAETTENIFHVMTSPTSIKNASETFRTKENKDISSSPDINTSEQYLQQYQRSITEFRDGNYNDKFPWKHDNNELPSDYEIHVEALMKDRPLTSVPTSNDDLEPLTPAHLLYGRPILSYPFNVGDKEVVDGTRNQQHVITKHDKQLRHVIDQYWTIWRREYLTALREQHRKTGSNNQTIRVGDIVQVHDDGPRFRWQLGVIEELMTGNAGLHRAAKIRMCRGHTLRPIVKLYPLEIVHQTSD